MQLPLHDGRKALVMTDLLFNMGPEDSNIVRKLLGVIGDGEQPFISPILKWFLVRDKKVYADWITKIATEVSFVVETRNCMYVLISFVR
jgi:hypothetical protein